MKKHISLLLVLVLLSGLLLLTGCEKDGPDVKTVADLLCCFDPSGITVDKLERMTITPEVEEEGIWYVYRLSVTLHESGGDRQDILGIISYQKTGSVPGLYSAYSQPGNGTEFFIWEDLSDNPEVASIKEYSDKETKDLVEKAWKYVEENNIHPE